MPSNYPIYRGCFTATRLSTYILSKGEMQRNDLGHNKPHKQRLVGSASVTAVVSDHPHKAGLSYVQSCPHTDRPNNERMIV